MKAPIRLLEKPLPKAPKKCLVTGRADGLIVDFGTDVQFPMPQPHVYIKANVVEEAAELLGMVPQEVVQELQDQVSAMTDELEQLRAVAEAIDAKEAADTQLEEALNGAHSVA